MTDVVLVQAPATILELSGPGAVPCLQGLVSSDIVKAGDASLTYGAILTPKGMIIADCWIVRLAGRVFLVAEPAAHDPILDTFRKSLPPRLAKVIDLGATWALVRVFGPASTLPPVPGTVARATTGALVCRGTAAAWFEGLLLGEVADVQAEANQLRLGGAHEGTGDDAERFRVLAGWPLLGREIDERTLVQEVRFDEHGGVAYDKGCFVGQETVARLHFRGHTNRNLRGLVWDVAGELEGRRVELEGKEVGRVGGTVLQGNTRVALALLRREVADGATVIAGGAPATVVPLPFSLPPRE